MFPVSRTYSGSDTHLRVLTLNCWGAPIAQYRTVRMKAIGMHLGSNSNSYDIVCLQEIWREKDWHLLRNAMLEEEANELKFSHRFLSGMMGSGLVILSRYPIIEFSFQCYNATGKFYKFWHGDSYGGKGIAHCVISSPFGLIDVYCTHTHANYQEHSHPREEYHGVRIAQVLQLAKYVKNSTRSNLAILMGDFNARPESPEICLLQKLGNLKDAHVEINGPEGGFTCVKENIFNRTGLLTSLLFPEPDSIYPCRLDYIFYLVQPSRNPKSEISSAQVKECQISFVEPDIIIQGRVNSNIPYSDHYGVEAVLSLSKNSSSDGKNERLSPAILGKESEIIRNALSEALKILDRSVKDGEHLHRRYSLLKWIILFIPLLMESLLVLYLSDKEMVLLILSVLVFMLFFTLFVLLFLVTTSIIPTEIATLKQAQAEARLLWQVHSDNLNSLRRPSLPLVHELSYEEDEI